MKKVSNKILWFLTIIGFVISCYFLFSHFQQKSLVENGKPKNLIESPVFLKPKPGEVFGKIYFPSLDEYMPIVEGTKYDHKGAGHMVETPLPGEKGNCYITGHNNTIFGKIGKIKNGEEIHIYLKNGTIYKYKKIKHYIVSEEDGTDVTRSSRTPKLSVQTCYPFGVFNRTPQRYIIEANLIR